jgi:type II secretory ATPase GspE/PulE/Tfp pilus assembly ATPase PilB-like protein
MSWPCLGWLVANGVITQAQPNRVQPRATDLGVAVDRALVLFGDCTNDDILTAKAEVYGIERVKLDEIEIPDAVIDLIPESVARECSVIPLEQDDEGLVVALSDPGDFDTIERLRFILNTAIVVKLASEEEIRSALDQCYAISTSEPLVLHDLERIKRLPDTLFLGRAFVFVGEAAAEKGWQGDQSVPHSRMVLPRAKGPLQLPGVSVDSATFPKLVLRSITSDKLLYESDRDTVHLLVVAPQWRSTEKTVRLLLNASQSTRHSVNLDVNGCGMLKLQNLRYLAGRRK